MAKDDQKPTPEKVDNKPRAHVLVVINRQGPYTAIHTAPGGQIVGGGGANKPGEGVRGLVVTRRTLWPGANLVEPDVFDVIKDLPGLRKRMAKNEIEVMPDGWLALQDAKRLAVAKETCCPKTLPRLLEDEPNDHVAAALRHQMRFSQPAPAKA
jgi:hypothetical protein